MLLVDCNQFLEVAVGEQPRIPGEGQPGLLPQSRGIQHQGVALVQLADWAREEEGWQQALRYYRRLREEDSRTRWASVAESAIERCRKEGGNPP